MRERPSINGTIPGGDPGTCPVSSSNFIVNTDVMHPSSHLVNRYRVRAALRSQWRYSRWRGSRGGADGPLRAGSSGYRGPQVRDSLQSQTRLSFPNQMRLCAAGFISSQSPAPPEAAAGDMPHTAAFRTRST